MNARSSNRPAPLALRLLAVPVVVAVLVLGLWLVAGRIAGGYWTSIGLGAAWFVLASFGFGRLTKARPAFRPFVRGAFAATALAAVVAFYWTSVRETTIDEPVVTGVPAGGIAEAPERRAETSGRRRRDAPPHRRRNEQVAAGAVEPVGHSGKGRAAVVRTARGDLRLTLTEFDIDPGPMVVVRLVAGERDEGGDFVELGDLKATRGNQQYAIPGRTDLERYRTVVFWCVPFSQSLARAALRPS